MRRWGDAVIFWGQFFGVRLGILRFGGLHKKVGSILLTKGVDESVGLGLKCGGKINENACF